MPVTIKIHIFVHFQEQFLPDMNKKELNSIIQSIYKLWPDNPPYLTFQIFSGTDDLIPHLFITCYSDGIESPIPKYLIDGLCNKFIQIRPKVVDSSGERLLNGVEVYFKLFR